MLFNSLDFAVFLPVVFILYWFVFKGSISSQNKLVVLASYVFYGWWDWRFLSLIILSTLADYSIGVALGNTNNASRRKGLLWTSIILNLGLLGFFKYANFFVENFTAAFSFLGAPITSSTTLNIVLPVGISFYTFQTLSYTIDVYRKHMEPTRNLIAFSAFVSFFPQLVAGPIERAAHLLPQFFTQRIFNYQLAVAGLRQILWGLFKKVVIADNCATYADMIFNDSEFMPASMLILGPIFFAFQIYGDFSGYSDIAIGTARLFGFDLRQNFAFPYFSRDIAEFWRRWHISLSTWFRDYLYIPLGGSRGSTSFRVRNAALIFVISGFWHGANWTYILWGALNAIFFIPLLLTNTHRKHMEIIGAGGARIPLKEIGLMVFTFAINLLAWICFRAENVAHIGSYLSGIWSSSILTFPHVLYDSGAQLTIGLVAVFLCIEWVGRSDKFGIERFGINWHWLPRYGFYYALILLVLWFGGNEQTFIYFQF